LLPSAEIPIQGGGTTEACGEYSNYYCLNPRNPQCCWLNDILSLYPETEILSNRIWASMAYFRYMSMAFARTCSGDVYVISEATDAAGLLSNNRIGGYDSIWNTHEIPILRERFSRGYVTKLWLLNAVPQAGNADTLTTIPRGSAVDVTTVISSGSQNPPGVIQDLGYPQKLRRGLHGSDMDKTQRKALRNSTLVLGKRGSYGAADWEDPRSDYFG
jgi:hypothetical protein